MPLKHTVTIFHFTPLKVLFFITQFCFGETGKVSSGASFLLVSWKKILHVLALKILYTDIHQIF